MSRHLRVAVVRGGPNDEYHHSMRVGSTVLDVLTDLGYPCKDIIVSKVGEWLDGGFVRQPLHALTAVDVVFIAQRGPYAEDGTLQRQIARSGVPYTGSPPLASAMAYHKGLAKQALRKQGIRFPRHRLVRRSERELLRKQCAEIAEQFGPEYVLKPARGASSRGLRHVKRSEDLVEVLEGYLDNDLTLEEVLVEEFIRGREATTALLESFRAEQHYVFPAVEVSTPVESPYHDTESKLSDSIKTTAPGRFSLRERESLAAAARTAHEQLGFSQYSRSDFIVRDGDAYFLEINPLPQLSRRALYPEAAAAAGLTYEQLIEHLVQTAR